MKKVKGWKWKWKWKVIVPVMVLLASVMLIFYFRYAECVKHENRGAKLITKIEDYRQQQQKLPNTVADLGLIEPMGEGPYYEKVDSLNYIVFFTIGFDTTKTYYSKTKEWKYEP